MNLRMKLGIAVFLGTLTLMGCGSEESHQARGSGAGFQMGYITIVTEQNGQNTLEFTLNQPQDLATAAVHIMGVGPNDVAVGLYNPPDGLYLTQTNEALPDTATQANPAARGSQVTYYFGGNLPKAGKYHTKVVVRHINNCLALAKDSTSCRDARFLNKIDKNYDVSTDITLNVLAAPITPINSRQPQFGGVQPATGFPGQAPGGRTGPLGGLFRAGI